jgi:hypothetical protein
MGKPRVAPPVSQCEIRYGAKRVQALAHLLEDITLENIGPLRSKAQREHLRYAIVELLSHETDELVVAMLRDQGEAEGIAPKSRPRVGGNRPGPARVAPPVIDLMDGLRRSLLSRGGPK